MQVLASFPVVIFTVGALAVVPWYMFHVFLVEVFIELHEVLYLRYLVDLLQALVFRLVVCSRGRAHVEPCWELEF